jgi:hypothetical protein
MALGMNYKERDFRKGSERRFMESGHFQNLDVSWGHEPAGLVCSAGFSRSGAPPPEGGTTNEKFMGSPHEIYSRMGRYGIGFCNRKNLLPVEMSTVT